MVRERIFFAGGGTGGHLYPGLAIARAVVRLAPQVEPYFIGARRGIERDILPGTEFPHTLLELHPLYRRTPWNNWRTVVGAVSAWRAISSLARERAPRAVIGTGGYAAGVALAWGRMHGVPTMLHEPDSHPGLTTRAFAGGARAIYLGFPEAAQRLKIGSGAAVLPLGCPIEPPPVPPPARGAARAQWGLPEDALVVLVTGGSQGARAVNETVAAWIDLGLPDNVCLLWSTGRQQAAAWVDRESARVKVRPYLARLPTPMPPQTSPWHAPAPCRSPSCVRGAFPHCWCHCQRPHRIIRPTTPVPRRNRVVPSICRSGN